MFSALALLLVAFVTAVESHYGHFLAGVAFGRGRRGGRSYTSGNCGMVWVSEWKWPFFWLEKRCRYYGSGPLGYSGEYQPAADSEKAKGSSYRDYSARQLGFGVGEKEREGKK